MACGTLAPTWAWVEGGGGGTPGFQPVTSPASESNRNSAGPLAAPAWTSNPGVGLKTCPVGAPPGMFTTNGALLMGLPLTKPGEMVALSVPLSATHTGVVGPAARPQGLTRSGSVSWARPGRADAGVPRWGPVSWHRPGRSETRLVWW